MAKSKQDAPKQSGREALLSAMLSQLSKDHQMAVDAGNAAAAVAASRATIDLLSLKLAGNPVGSAGDASDQVIRVVIGGRDSGRVDPSRPDEDIGSLGNDTTSADDSLARRLLALLDGDGNG